MALVIADRQKAGMTATAAGLVRALERFGSMPLAELVGSPKWSSSSGEA